MGGILGMLARPACSAPWSIEPRLGGTTEYDSNPGLREVDPVSEQHIAALIDLPLRYDGDGVEFGFRPYGRVSNSSGYSSLASDYAHLDANAQLTGDRWSASLLANLARDTSLYHAGELVNGVGVRRDTASSSAQWAQLMTERLQIQLDGGWSYVKYAQSQPVNGLTDYRYFSGGPSAVYTLNALTSLKASGTYGNYQSVNGLTQSKSEQAQLGFVRQLSELWSLTTTAGYSHSQDSEKYFFGPFYLGTSTYNQDGTVYAVSLTRQGEKLNLTGGVSQTLQPTGLAFLSRQDNVNLTATYTYSERLDFGVNAGWQKVENPTFGAGVNTVRYLNAQLTANWHWTPQWVMSVHAGRVSQVVGPPTYSAGSNGISLDVIRQFLRVDL
jgi:hypothetical protein